MSGEATTSEAVGAVLRDLRTQRGLSARDLAAASGVSAAMVSRIEGGRVSPSLATLSSLAVALDTPLASLFRETGAPRADLTHVKAGEGLVATRVAGSHAHEFTVLGFHNRPGLRFEPVLVTLTRHEDARPPEYRGAGCVFLHMLEGEALYGWDSRRIRLGPGDSLSFDAEPRHGFLDLISERVRFLSVQAERR